MFLRWLAILSRQYEFNWPLLYLNESCLIHFILVGHVREMHGKWPVATWLCLLLIVTVHDKTELLDKVIKACFLPVMPILCFLIRLSVTMLFFFPSFLLLSRETLVSTIYECVLPGRFEVNVEQCSTLGCSHAVSNCSWLAYCSTHSYKSLSPYFPTAKLLCRHICGTYY